MSFGFTTLPRDLDIFSPPSPRIMPWLVRLAYGSFVGTRPIVVEELVPEAGVQQMERRVLHAAVVPVHGRPVFESFRTGESLCCCAGPYSAGNTTRSPPTAAWCRSRAGPAPPHFGQVVLTQSVILESGRFAVVRRLVALDLREQERKLILRQRHPAARRALYHRDGLAPVALAGEYPVAQLEVRLGMADALVRHATSSWRG